MICILPSLLVVMTRWRTCGSSFICYKCRTDNKSGLLHCL